MILHIIGSAVAFKLVWLACVMGAASGRPWLGPLALLLSLALHLAIVRDYRRDLQVVAALATLGVVFDSLFAASGMLEYAAPLPFAGLAPLWIVAMWANFGLLLNHAMSWLRGRYLLAAALGLIGGPMAYLAGRSLGGVQFGASETIVIAALAAAWALAVPVAVRISERTPGRASALASSAV